MKLVVAGNAVVITSEVKLDDLVLIKRYRPEALILMGGKDGDEELFRIAPVETTGTVNQYGITFADVARDGSGKATVTVPIEYKGEEVKEWIADKFGGALMYLEKIEATLPGVVQEIASEKEAVMANISIA